MTAAEELLARARNLAGEAGVTIRESSSTSTEVTIGTDLDTLCRELMVPSSIKARIEQANDRSIAHQALVRACLEAGLDDRAVKRLVAFHGPSRAKYGARLDAEVVRSINKARADMAAKADDDEERVGAWAPVDLRAAWDGGGEPLPASVLRRSDGVAIYPPGLNGLFGDSGDGKSLLLQLAMVQVLRDGGHVIWVTYEDANAYELVKRLRLFGVTVDELDRLAVIVATDDLREGTVTIAAMIRQHRTALVVLDSVGEALAVSGVDEDKDAQFGPWARATVRRLIDLAGSTDWDHDKSRPNEHVAVVPIDHSTKSKDNPHFPSGSKRKRAMLTGTLALLHVREPFGVGQVGRVQLVCSKDRGGRFRRGEIMAEITIDATTDPYTVSIDPPAAGATMVTGRKRKAEERVLQVLDLAGARLDAAEIHRQVNNASNRLPGEAELTIGTVKNALTRLHKRPGVIRENEPTGVGNAYRILYRVEPHESDGVGGDDNA